MLEQTRNSVIVGMGEIGSAFYQILKEAGLEVYGFDIYKDKIRGAPPEKVDVLHICIPFVKAADFHSTVENLIEEYQPQEVVIHSSVAPRTTANLALHYPEPAIPFVYSPWRGVHSRMKEDMKRYVKYYAFFGKEPSLFVQEMRTAGFNIQPWNDTPTSLELAKLLEVTYYGWLIIWAQHKKIIADEYGVDDEKLWQFTDEVHKFLGNRPRMFAGEGIGGHCVMQDKDLLNDSFLDIVFSHDQYYRRNLNGFKK